MNQSFASNFKVTMAEYKPGRGQEVTMIHLVLPLSSETLPESDGALMANCHNPAMSETLHLGAHAHIGLQPKPQEQAAQQDSMILTILVETVGTINNPHSQATFSP